MHLSAYPSKMELNTKSVWSMVSTRHVVVTEVDDCWVAIAKTCRASSSGKFSMEKATVWYTILPTRFFRCWARRVARSCR